MGNYTREEILAMAEEEDVEFIRLQFTDMFGTLKNIAITARELPLLKNTLVHGRNYSNRSILCQPFFKRGKSSKALSRKHEQFF